MKQAQFKTHAWPSHKMLDLLSIPLFGLLQVPMMLGRYLFINPKSRVRLDIESFYCKQPYTNQNSFVAICINIFIFFTWLMYIDKKVLNPQRITFFPKLKINFTSKIWGCGEHQKMLGSIGIPHFGIPQVSSNKLSPAKHVLTEWKARAVQMKVGM